MEGLGCLREWCTSDNFQSFWGKSQEDFFFPVKTRDNLKGIIIGSY